MPKTYRHRLQRSFFSQQRHRYNFVISVTQLCKNTIEHLLQIIMTELNQTTLNMLCYENCREEIYLIDYSHNLTQHLSSWCALAFFLFFVGLIGMMCNYRSFLVTMMSAEVMYVGVTMSFVLYGVAMKDSEALIYALIILIFAACESAVGLGLLIVLYRFGFSVTFNAHSALHSTYYLLLQHSSTASTELTPVERLFLSLTRNQALQTHFHLAVYGTLIVLLFLLLAVIAYIYALSHSKGKDAEKSSEYECGFAPFDSATRLPFDVHFYLVGILFLIFDVEVALLFPWTILISSMSWYAFFSMVGFVLILTVGFIYEWRRGVLNWPKRSSRNISEKAVVLFLVSGTNGPALDSVFWQAWHKCFLITVLPFILFVLIFRAILSRKSYEVCFLAGCSVHPEEQHSSFAFSSNSTEQ